MTLSMERCMPMQIPMIIIRAELTEGPKPYSTGPPVFGNIF